MALKAVKPIWVLLEIAFLSARFRTEAVELQIGECESFNFFELNGAKICYHQNQSSKLS